ncbi:MAG: inverse autotransporter beta domain-containing protein [Pseudomonadota bacterium]
MRASLIALILSCASTLPVMADDFVLSPRVEAAIKAGTDRNILQGGAWVPLTQTYDSVLYTDLRLTGDNHEAREGNAGFGYRTYLSSNNAVIGGFASIDRLHSPKDNTFDRLTFGGEYMGDQWELRGNGFVPLTNAQSFNKDGCLTFGSFRPAEEIQKGFDLELGMRIPAFEGDIDSWRAYAGAYHFSGDKTENIHGVRVRSLTDITPNLSIGATWQHDNNRDSQALLSLRYKLGDVPSFQTYGVRARLAEAPHRESDMITNGMGAKKCTFGQMTNIGL